MTHLMEPVNVLPPTSSDAHNSHCVFCKEVTSKESKSFIGEDNNSTTLGNNLDAKGQPRRTFSNRTYGDFSSEPHHLTPGNEALKGHGLEQWLAASAGGVIEADTGFDINSHYNGIWLPSVHEDFVGESGWSWRKKEHGEMAVILMEQYSLQFHKGGHKNKGGLDAASSEPDRCYIKAVEDRLNKLLKHVDDWKKLHCPIEKKKKSPEKSRPPYFVNDLLYAHVSTPMSVEVSGPPDKWKVFISRVAYLAHLESKKRKSKKRKRK